MANKQKWFHAIGVCGHATSNVAKMFKDMGWFVTGSDIAFNPPASDILEDAGIPHVEGYDWRHMTRDYWLEELKMKNEELMIGEHPDLCLVVESVSEKNKEYRYAKVHGIDVRPYSQILGEYLVKPESIVVTGTAGKTTTSALLIKMFQDLSFEPSYMVAGDTDALEGRLKNTESQWSILEGDEYHSLQLSRGAKFLEYKPMYVILTNIGWEHQDIFPTQERYIEEFRKLVKAIPENGLLVARYGDKYVDEIIDDAVCKVVRYRLKNKNDSEQTKETAWEIEKKGTLFTIFDDRGHEILSSESMLIGDYNYENIVAAVTLVCNLPSEKISAKVLLEGTNSLRLMAKTIQQFSGVKKRLEVIYQDAKTTIVDDYGVAPDRARNSLHTLRKAYSEYEIVAIFEPNSASRFNDEKQFKKAYAETFVNSDHVIIPTLSTYNDQLATPEHFVERLKELDIDARHVPTEDLNAYLLSEFKISNSKFLFVFFSSYRLTTVAKELKKMIVKS